MPTKTKVKTLYSYKDQTKGSEGAEAVSQAGGSNILEPYLLLLADFSRECGPCGA